LPGLFDRLPLLAVDLLLLDLLLLERVPDPLRELASESA
jgi:hypothetical protein